LHSSLTSCTH